MSYKCPDCKAEVQDEHVPCDCPPKTPTEQAIADMAEVGLEPDTSPSLGGAALHAVYLHEPECAKVSTHPLIRRMSDCECVRLSDAFNRGAEAMRLAAVKEAERACIACNNTDPWHPVDKDGKARCAAQYIRDLRL